MKVTRLPDGTFELLAECDADEDFAGALYVHRHCAWRGPLSTPAGGGGRRVIGARLCVASDSPEALRAQAGSEVLRGLGNLFRLGLREAANHCHVGASSTNPEAKEALPAGLVQIQLVLQALGLEIVQKEAVRQEGGGAHGVVSSSSEICNGAAAGGSEQSGSAA